MQNNHFILSLKTAYFIAPDVKHFVFEFKESVPFEYKPGQFITLYFHHQDKLLHRSYSIANPPNTDHPSIEFAVSLIKEGPGSEFLFKLIPGDSIEAKGPFGRLVLRPSLPKRVIFVSTGTGITPYRSMLPSLAEHLKKDKIEIVFLQGVRTRKDALYHDEFMSFANEHPSVNYVLCLSREATTLNQNESPGYVQHMFESLGINVDHDLIYLCGNPQMIDESLSWLKEKNISTEHIIREKYISR